MVGYILVFVFIYEYKTNNRLCSSCSICRLSQLKRYVFNLKLWPPVLLLAWHSKPSIPSCFINFNNWITPPLIQPDTQINSTHVSSSGWQPSHCYRWCCSRQRSWLLRRSPGWRLDLSACCRRPDWPGNRSAWSAAERGPWPRGRWTEGRPRRTPNPLRRWWYLSCRPRRIRCSCSPTSGLPECPRVL